MHAGANILFVQVHLIPWSKLLGCSSAVRHGEISSPAAGLRSPGFQMTLYSRSWCRILILSLRMEPFLELAKMLTRGLWYLMKFIKIMRWLRKLKNFNSYLAILSALDSAPVRRLEWQKQNIEVRIEKKNENCTILILKGNSYCTTRATPGDLCLKSHRKVTHPSTNRGRCCLT